jgi:hypothetical protein
VRTVLLALLLAVPGEVVAEVADPLIANGFTEVDAASVSEWNSRVDSVYTVSTATDCLQIEVGTEGVGGAVSLRQGRYLYEGTDDGEWGGELRVTARDEVRVLLSDNVRALVPTQDGLLVFTGLAHLGISRGAVHRVLNPASDPVLERITLLPDAPVIVLQHKESTDAVRTVILGASSLMLLSDLGSIEHLEVLLVDQPWLTLYPGSAVIVGDELIFGMRGGIGVLHVSSFSRDSPPRFFTFTELSQALADNNKSGETIAVEPLCISMD